MGILSRLIKVTRSHLGHVASSRRFNRDPPMGNTWHDTEPLGRGSENPSERATREARYYANLELPLGAPYGDIKQAYRRLLRKYHPDLHGKDAMTTAVAEKITKQLNEAMHYFEQSSKNGGG